MLTIIRIHKIPPQGNRSLTNSHTYGHCENRGVQRQQYEEDDRRPWKHSPVTRTKKFNARDRSEIKQAGNEAELSCERTEYNLATDHTHKLTTSHVELVIMRGGVC